MWLAGVFGPTLLLGQLDSPEDEKPDYELYLEAEAAEILEAFTVVSDEEACGSLALTTPTSIDRRRLRGREEASLQFIVPRSGAYSLWARLFARRRARDATYLGFDSSFRRVWPPALGAFQWVKVATAELQEGKHKISLGRGEPGAVVDLLLVTDRNDWNSSGFDCRRTQLVSTSVEYDRPLVTSIPPNSHDLIRLQHNELWSKGNLEIIGKSYTANSVGYLFSEVRWQGPGELADQVKRLRLSFPDWTERIVEVISEGQMLVARFVVSGTHQKEYLGIPSSGARFTSQGVAIYRLAGERIVEVRRFVNLRDSIRTSESTETRPRK